MKEKLEVSSSPREDDDLTKREVEILKLLAEGLFNKEIAIKLDIRRKLSKSYIQYFQENKS